MTESARDWLMDPKVSFGGEAGGTGGDSSAGTGESFTKEPPFAVYGESKGVYGGATIKGGSIVANDKANENYYGQFYSVKDILFDKKVKASDTATEFAKKLDAAANAK